MRHQLGDERSSLASTIAAAFVSWAAISASSAILLTLLLLQINDAEGDAAHVAGLLGSMLWITSALNAFFLLVSLAALALYVRTLYPGLLAGDSGEFQALARLLGNTHPTGYQIYLLLVYLIHF